MERFIPRPLLVVAMISLVAGGGCAASTKHATTSPEQEMCVVSIEPQMRMVTFAAPEGLADGVTSLFFAQMPDLGPGDLVRVDNTAGHGGPRIGRIEPSAKSCADVAQSAADHHKHH